MLELVYKMINFISNLSHVGLNLLIILRVLFKYVIYYTGEKGDLLVFSEALLEKTE